MHASVLCLYSHTDKERESHTDKERESAHQLDFLYCRDLLADTTPKSSLRVNPFAEPYFGAKYNGKSNLKSFGVSELQLLLYTRLVVDNYGGPESSHMYASGQYD